MSSPLEIISDVFEAIGKIFAFLGAWGNAILAIIVGIFIFWVLFVDDGTNSEPPGPEIVVKTVEIGDNLYETGKEIAPELVETTKENLPILIDVYCEVDELILSQIELRAIETYMLENVEPRDKSIMEKWSKTNEVTACEVAIINDSLEKNEFGEIYKNKLRINNVVKNLKGCTIAQCIEQYDLLNNLTFEKKEK